MASAHTSAAGSTSSAFRVHGVDAAPRTPVAIRIPASLAERLARADIQINGDRRWDIRVYNTELVKRLRWRGLLGLGEAYVDGWWECDAIDELFARSLAADVRLPEAFAAAPANVLNYLRDRLFNMQNFRRARKNIHAHYDQGNDLFEATLDSRMQYTCGYWRDGITNLEEAQLAKIELICTKLGLRPGMRVLELGIGWGGLAKHMAQQYGCSVVGYTISAEQQEYIRQHCAGLDVDVRLADYRTATGTFDRVVSVGMFEHVGPKNYRPAIQVVHDCLPNGGLALIHFFASAKSFPNLTHSELHWIDRYIFPGLVIPSIGQIGAALEDRLVLEDLHNFGAHYDPTLMAWAENFERNYPGIADRYPPSMYRLWNYYLRSAAGAFRARRYQLWQLVLSKGGVPGGYRSFR